MEKQDWMLAFSDQEQDSDSHSYHLCSTLYWKFYPEHLIRREGREEGDANWKRGSKTILSVDGWVLHIVSKLREEDRKIAKNSYHRWQVWAASL